MNILYSNYKFYKLYFSSFFFSFLFFFIISDFTLLLTVLAVILSMLLMNKTATFYRPSYMSLLIAAATTRHANLGFTKLLVKFLGLKEAYNIWQWVPNFLVNPSLGQCDQLTFLSYFALVLSNVCNVSRIQGWAISCLLSPMPTPRRTCILLTLLLSKSSYELSLFCDRPFRIYLLYQKGFFEL